MNTISQHRDGYENDYFDTTTALMLEISFDSKGYGTFDVLLKL